MRAVSDAMRAKIQSGRTTFCLCFRFALNGGTFLLATNLDHDITIGGVIYKSAPGITSTKIAETGEFDPSNLEMDILVDESLITIPMLRSGKFARAKVKMFVIDYNDPPNNFFDDEKIIWIKTGTVGNIRTDGKLAKLEFRGFEQILKQNIVATGSRFCRATLGDSACTKDLTSFTDTGTVTAHTSKDVTLSYSLDSNYLSNGYIEITAGEYTGARFDVATNSGSSVKLLDLPAINLTGLSIKSVAGCDKSLDVCFNTFNNVINFQGEPHVPTRDSAITGKNAKAGSVNQSQSGGGK